METRALIIDQSPPTAIDKVKPWYPLPGEPHMWNERFTHYYLTQPSVNRSMLQAYRQYRIDKAETEQERTDAINVNYVSEGWYNAGVDWQWSERAQAYDRHITDRILEQSSEALEIHKAHKLTLWAEYIERASREMAKRNLEEAPLSLLASTIKTLDNRMQANLPQQPQLHAHVIALHPELQALIRDAIEKRK